MLYLKAFLIGVVTAIVLAVVVAGAEIQIKLRHIHQESVFNDGAASVASGPAALVGFAAGFYWTVRRGRRKATAA